MYTLIRRALNTVEDRLHNLVGRVGFEPTKLFESLVHPNSQARSYSPRVWPLHYLTHIIGGEGEIRTHAALTHYSLSKRASSAT